jgi:hypothetical protein
MEEKLGHFDDASHLFERSLQKFESGTAEKKQLWRAYELMEQRIGNEAGAQEVYRRSMRESFAAAKEELEAEEIPDSTLPLEPATIAESIVKPEREFETARWNQGSTSMKAEIWLTNEGAIEGKIPRSSLKKKNPKLSPPPQQKSPPPTDSDYESTTG